MFTIVALPFDTYQSLPPLEFKLLAAVIRYVNKLGECWPALRQLAADIGMSEATVSRGMVRLVERGCLTRERPCSNGRYVYQVMERFLPRWPRTDSRLAEGQAGLSQRARQEANPTKHAKKDSQNLGEGELPDDRARWPARVRSWRKSRFWLPGWGPKPNEPGCWAPRELLAAL